jgi:predicted flap endonuclease-1-like 5' DNA nuclease
MSERTDLTRWNRAGLSTFRYVDGNAATYLEDLRLALRERFESGEWAGIDAIILVPEEDSARVERLLEQYRDRRPDWGWEILRTLARSCHVLAGYTDAYANEGFLGTASQWESVRRLVGMLDYHPSPPASASTRLVIEAKEDQDPGTLETGFQVKHSPPDGGKPVIFETLLDAEVDSALNGLRLEGWNRSVEPLVRDGPIVKSPVGQRRARDIQGVGEVYAQRLDAYKRGLPASPIGTILSPILPTLSLTPSPLGVFEIDLGVGLVAAGGLAADPFAAFTFGARGSLDAIFTIADFIELDPGPARVDISPVRLWEFKKKAELLLGIDLDAQKFDVVLDLPAAEVAEMSLARLQALTSLPTEDIEELQDELRKVQIALDEPAFDDDSSERRFLLRIGREVELRFPAVRLRDLVGGIAAPESPWIAPDDVKISAGALGVVVREQPDPRAAVVRVDEVASESAEVMLKDAPEQPDWRPWLRGVSRLLVGPKFIELPRLNGPGVVTFAEAHGLSSSEVIAWQEGGNWVFARITETDEFAARLEGDSSPPAGTDLYQALEIDRGADGLRFPASYQVAVRPSGSGFSEIVASQYTETGTGADRYRTLTSTDVQQIYLVTQGAEVAGRAVATVAGAYTFDGAPGKLAAGQWTVAEDGQRYWPLEIESIAKLESSFVVRFTGAAVPLPSVAALSVEVVQGVGPTYATRLSRRGVQTLAELAALSVESIDVAISPVRLWEFKTKAELLLGFSGHATTLEPVLGQTLSEVVRKSDADLAGDLGSTESEAREIKSGLRLIEAVIDQPTFESTTVGELLPNGGPSMGGETPVLERLVRLYGDFEHEIRATGWDRNLTPVTGTTLQLDANSLTRLPSLLERGRKLILEQESGDDFEGAIEAEVMSVDPVALTVEVSPALTSNDGFTLGNTVVRGNVAAAGHGERKPRKVLGSGDATATHPSFVLEVEGVSFVADATQPSGVRADITVEIGNQKWLQVANLKDSDAADPAYTVRMTEDGYIRIGFGDGRHGRRVPSGTNNIRVSYRVGTGLDGNLAEGSLKKAVRPHYLVESVRQPVAASGGGDLETLTSLRDNAPASLLTLERAVSLADFTHLAARQSSVWQARAFSRSSGRERYETVEVVVVPAGGGELGDLEDTLRDFLNAHAIPGVNVEVSPYEPIRFDLEATLRIDPDLYSPDDVLENVRQALIDGFSLAKRKLGQDLFLSEVFQVVEGTNGVQNSTCIINELPTLRRLGASDREVIYLEPSVSRLDLIYKEYEP